MKRIDGKLTDQHARFVARRSAENRVACAAFDRRSRQQIARLTVRGVTTVRELIAVLPELPPKLKHFGLWWLSVMKVRIAEGTLLKMLHDDPSSRLECAVTLSAVGGVKSIQELVSIGKEQLAAKTPDWKWLNSVIKGLRGCSLREGADVLLAIYERTDLPGWLRGEAGDALGCCSQIHDRRTSFFRRALSTAIKGLHESDIDVQFWSMYVLMQLAQNYSTQSHRSNARFKIALPRLGEIAATDHRLAPGYWWPMSAEAEDAIHYIKHGHGLEKDAADRWIVSVESRGPMNREDE